MSVAVRSTVGRSVHVKIHPRPRSVNESREILRVLQQYGEVEMFKNLKYEPRAPAANTALAIYKTVESAERAIDATPVRFLYGQASSVRSLGDSAAWRAQSGKEQEQSPSTTDRATSEDNASFPVSNAGTEAHSTAVTLAIRPSAMNHTAYIARQAYYGAYPRAGSSVMYDDLLRRLPPGLHGMAQLELSRDETPLRLRIRRDAERQRWMGEVRSLRELWKQGKGGLKKPQAM